MLSAGQILDITKQISELNTAPDTVMARLPPEAAHFGALSETPQVILKVRKYVIHDLGLEERVIVCGRRLGVAELRSVNAVGKRSVLLVV